MNIFLTDMKWIYPIRTLIILLIFFSITSLSGQNLDNPELYGNLKFDHQLSPNTGYTRAHWLYITERIIAGVLPYFDPESGLPILPDNPDEPAYADLRFNDTDITYKRALERIMTAVIIYCKATIRCIFHLYSV